MEEYVYSDTGPDNETYDERKIEQGQKKQELRQIFKEKNWNKIRDLLNQENLEMQISAQETPIIAIKNRIKELENESITKNLKILKQLLGKEEMQDRNKNSNEYEVEHQNENQIIAILNNEDIEKLTSGKDEQPEEFYAINN